MLYHLSSHFGMAPFSAQHRRDLTVALVGFTSWAAVAWKLGRPGGAEADASKTEGLLAWVRPPLCRRRRRRSAFTATNLQSCKAC